LDSSLQEENGNISPPKSPLPSWADAVCLDYFVVIPPSHGTWMYLKKASHLTCSQHIAHLLIMHHFCGYHPSLNIISGSALPSNQQANTTSGGASLSYFHPKLPVLIAHKVSI